MTLTSSSEIAPDGTATASLFTVSTGYTPIARSSIGQTAGATFTMSGHFKAGTGTTVNLLLGNQSLTTYAYATFNLLTGVVSTTGIIGTGSTYKNSAITNLGNGWYRCTFSIAASAALYGMAGLYTTSATYSGDGTSNLYIYGAQLEVGAYPTSYIPTTTATVTRNADACTKSTATALIGQTEGTMFWDVNFDSRQANTAFVIKNSANTSFIRIIAAGLTIQATVSNASTTTALIDLTNSSTGRFKLAVAYKNDDIVFYANGVLVGTDTSSAIPATTDIDLFQVVSNGCLTKSNVYALWKTRLTNSELAQQVISNIQSFEPDYVRVDAGRGEGVIDYIRSHGYKCTEVNFGGRPTSEYYANARAEMWDGMKKWLQSGGCIPNIPELISELSAPEYEFSTTNKLVLESKEKLRDRGLRSPDYADALALAVGVPLMAKAGFSIKNKSEGLTSVRKIQKGKSVLQSRR